MDKFERMMQQMAKMSQQEMTKMMESNKKICICPTCPMTEQIGLTHKFFCTRGTEKEQRGM